MPVVNLFVKARYIFIRVEYKSKKKKSKKKYLLHHLGVTGRWLGVVCRRGQCAGRVETSSFHFHSFHFPLFCLRKLCGYDYQTQVYHEKRSDLKKIKLCMNKSFFTQCNTYNVFLWNQYFGAEIIIWTWIYTV